MELRITKARVGRDVTEHLAADALTPFQADVPLAPAQDYAIPAVAP